MRMTPASTAAAGVLLFVVMCQGYLTVKGLSRILDDYFSDPRGGHCAGMTWRSACNRVQLESVIAWGRYGARRCGALPPRQGWFTGGHDRGPWREFRMLQDIRRVCPGGQTDTQSSARVLGISQAIRA